MIGAWQNKFERQKSQAGDKQQRSAPDDKTRRQQKRKNGDGMKNGKWQQQRFNPARKESQHRPEKFDVAAILVRKMDQKMMPVDNLRQSVGDDIEMTRKTPVVVDLGPGARQGGNKQ